MPAPKDWTSDKISLLLRGFIFYTLEEVYYAQSEKTEIWKLAL